MFGLFSEWICGQTSLQFKFKTLLMRLTTFKGPYKLPCLSVCLPVCFCLSICPCIRSHALPNVYPPLHHETAWGLREFRPTWGRWRRAHRPTNTLCLPYLFFCRRRLWRIPSCDFLIYKRHRPRRTPCAPAWASDPPDTNSRQPAMYIRIFVYVYVWCGQLPKSYIRTLPSEIYQ